jgi:predicted AlkP superfamily phosphohydrolase/phosphomutase
VKRYKIIVVGWDGATWDLIRPWAEAGYLPAVARIMSEGAAGELRSIIPPTTAPAWTSMMTGTNPARHGLMDWITRRPGAYTTVPLTADFCTQKTMWELLGEAGHRVFTFNVPMTYPPRPLNGLVVAGLGVPTLESDFTYPPELYQEIVSRIGEYILHPNPGQPDTPAQVEAFLQRLYRMTDIHFRTLDYLRHKEDWHAWMAVVSGTDAIQHVMWRFVDPYHSQYDPQEAKRFGGEVVRFFQYVDQALGRLLDSLDQDTVLFLVSDHGFGSLEKWFHVNTWLLEQGFIVLKRGPWSRLKRRMFQLGFTPMNVYDVLRALGLGKLKAEVAAGRGGGRLRALLPLVFLSFDDVDWSRTRAYALGQIGPIYFNLKGREPQGIVDLGSETEALWEEIVERLRQVCDPDDGEPIVGDVYRPQELYDGPHLDKAPDIIYMPPSDARKQTVGFGEVDFGTNRIVAPMHRALSGGHRLNGLFMAFGEPIKPGVWLEGAQLTDVAPTALHLGGLPVPEDMDGSVLVEALRTEYAEPASIRYGPPASRDDGRDGEIMSAEDEAILKERLRDLGYAT